MNSVPDITQITSTAEDVSELESTQRDSVTTEQNNSDDDTSIDTDVVTQRGSLEGDDVTNSSMPVDRSKLQTDFSKEEEVSTESPSGRTGDESTTSDSTESAPSDGVISPTDRSGIKPNSTLLFGNEVTSTDASKDSASTGHASQHSTDVSLVPEESTTPRDEHDPGLETTREVPESSHLTERSSLSSTSILDSRSSDSYASTHTRNETSTSTSTSTTKQYAWKTSTPDDGSSSTLQPSIVISTADKVSGSMKETEGGGGAIGYAAGATVSCLLLVVIIVSVLIIYRRTRKKTRGFADQDVTDYRSLVKSPSKRQDKDGSSSAPLEAFPPSPLGKIREEEEEEVGIDIPLSASNFRTPHFEVQFNGSKQKEAPENAKEIPMEDIAKTCAGNPESYSFNSFRPNPPKTTDIQ